MGSVVEFLIYFGLAIFVIFVVGIIAHKSLTNDKE